MEGYSYHDDFDHKSKTMLSLFVDSPTDYNLTYNTREKLPKPVGKPAMIGSIGHAVLLEGKRLDDIALVYPASCLNKNGDLNAKPAEAYRNECAGYYCLKQSEFAAIESALDGMRRHTDFIRLVENATTREQPYFAELEGVKCKCKPDILCDLGNEIVIYDPKFMENIYPKMFWASAKRFKYFLQQVHYSAVVQAHFGKPVRFKFVAIETEFPYRLQPYFYEGIDLDNAITSHVSLLNDLRGRYESGDWSDNWEAKGRLNMWDMPGWDDDNAMVPFHEGEA